MTPAQELIRDICEMDDPPETCERAVTVDLDWLQSSVESLLKQARKDALMEAAEYADRQTVPMVTSNELRLMADWSE